MSKVSKVSKRSKIVSGKGVRIQIESLTVQMGLMLGYDMHVANTLFVRAREDGLHGFEGREARPYVRGKNEFVDRKFPDAAAAAFWIVERRRARKFGSELHG